MKRHAARNMNRGTEIYHTSTGEVARVIWTTPSSLNNLVYVEAMDTYGRITIWTHEHIERL